MAEIKDIKFKLSFDTDDIKKANQLLHGTSVEAKEIKESFDKANDSARKAHNEIQEGANKSTGALKGIKGQITDFVKNIDIFGTSASDAFDKFDGGVGKAVKGLNGFKLALASTGIGVLIIAVGSLIAYFTKTEKGVEQLERVFASFRAGIDVIIGRFANLGSGLVDIFSGKISEGVKKLTSTFTGMGDEIIKAAKSANSYTEALQDIEDEQHNLELSAAATRNQIQKLAIESRNSGISELERKKLLRQADELEVGIVSKQIALQERKVKALAEENKLKIASGEIDKGNKTDALREAEIELENLRGNSLELRAKFLNREAALDKKGSKDKQLNIEKFNKWWADELKRVNEDALAEEQKYIDKSSKQVELSLEQTQVITGEKVDDFNQQLADSLSQYDSDHKYKDQLKRERDEAYLKKKAQIENAALQIGSAAENAFFQLRAQNREKDFQDLQLKQQAELKAAGDNKQQQAIINEKYVAKERQLRIKQAQDEKLQAIFSIVLNTAVAISKASPNPYAIALAAALGGAQLAVAASRPIPRYNKGTKRVPGLDHGDDSVLAMLRPGEGVMPVDRMNDYRPAFDAIFDRKVPADLLNSLVLNYGKAKVVSGSNSPIYNQLDTNRIIKAIESKQEVHVDIDKNGLKTYVTSGVTETHYANNYFKK